MFFCDPCRVEYEWPESMAISQERCEACETTSLCYDVPSKYLPVKKKVVDIRAI